MIDAITEVGMKRKLTAVDARKRLGEILEGVYYRGDEVIIERAGKPMAVVIPSGLYQSLQRNRERLLQLVELNWERNKDVPVEKSEREIAAAVREVRSKSRLL
jgi:prevent-host-death family protein